MKKVLTLLLALVMVLSLTACVASQPTTGSKNDPTKPTTAPTNKPTEPTTAPTVPTTAPTEPESNDEIVVVDNENFTVKVAGITSDEENYILTLYIENKGTVLLSFTFNNVITNNYVCPDISMYADVAAGENYTDSLIIPRTTLDRNGITDPAKLEFNLYVMNGETWADLFNENCTVYPQGEGSYVDDGGYNAQEGDTVLVDNDSVTVIVIGYEPENEMGYVVNLYVANKSDKSLLVAAEDVLVNDLVFDPWWSVEVPAGKRCVSQMIWYGDQFTTYGIGDITKIDFDLSAKDNTDPESPEFAGVHCALYPMGEEAYKPFERPEQDTDVVLMDNEYVTIIATSIGIDANGDYTMVLYMQNKADSNVFIKPTNVCLNGVEIDPWWGATVTAGKATFGSISWFAFALEENSITSVETITMTVTVFDELGENTFVSEDITINP